MPSLSDIGSTRANRTVVVAAALLLLVSLLGIWLVFRFVNSERERELQQWQIRLGIVAEGHGVLLAKRVQGGHGVRAAHGTAWPCQSCRPFVRPH